MGLKDAVVSEMIKQVPLKKIYTLTKCFHERFMGLMEGPRSWKIVKLVFLRKPDAEPKKGDQKQEGYCAHMSVFEVVHVLCHSLLGAREGTRNLEETACGRLEWKKLPTPASNGNKFTTKALGMAGRQNTMLRHGSVVRPTMDIKTAFDEARPRHVAKLMENP